MSQCLRASVLRKSPLFFRSVSHEETGGPEKEWRRKAGEGGITKRCCLLLGGINVPSFLRCSKVRLKRHAVQGSQIHMTPEDAEVTVKVLPLVWAVRVLCAQLVIGPDWHLAWPGPLPWVFSVTGTLVGVGFISEFGTGRQIEQMQ